jgi:CubicO group peptidase (beta-lactamase class C family)
VSVARANTWEAWIVLTERPHRPENPARQHRLHGSLASREIGGRSLEQWQYDVTAGGRIWYCPDPERRIVWVVAASTAHPKVTTE